MGIFILLQRVSKTNSLQHGFYFPITPPFGCFDVGGPPFHVFKLLSQKKTTDPTHLSHCVYQALIGKFLFCLWIRVVCSSASSNNVSMHSEKRKHEKRNKKVNITPPPTTRNTSYFYTCGTNFLSKSSGSFLSMIRRIGNSTLKLFKSNSTTSVTVPIVSILTPGIDNFLIVKENSNGKVIFVKGIMKDPYEAISTSNS